MTLADRPKKAMEKLDISEPKNRTKRPAFGHEPIFYANSSKEELMVGVRGLEPPASASRTLRATSCATPRYFEFSYNADNTSSNKALWLVGPTRKLRPVKLNAHKL